MLIYNIHKYIVIMYVHTMCICCANSCAQTLVLFIFPWCSAEAVITLSFCVIKFIPVRRCRIKNAINYDFKNIILLNEFYFYVTPRIIYYIVFQPPLILSGVSLITLVWCCKTLPLWYFTILTYFMNFTLNIVTPYVFFYFFFLC